MDISLPGILPTGIGGAAAQAAQAAARTTSAAAASTGALAKSGDLSGLTTSLTNGLTGAAGAADAGGAQNVVQSFGSVLAQALQDVNQTQQAADSDAAKLAAGDPVDLHQVMIGMESANLSLGLALQVRNKLLDAYQEVMRTVI